MLKVSPDAHARFARSFCFTARKHRHARIRSSALTCLLAHHTVSSSKVASYIRMPTAAEKNVAFPVLTVLIAMQKNISRKQSPGYTPPLHFLAPFLYHNSLVKRGSLFIFRTSNCVVLDTFHTSLYSRGKHYSKSICDAHAHDQAGRKPHSQGPTLSHGWDLGRLGRGGLHCAMSDSPPSSRFGGVVVVLFIESVCLYCVQCRALRQ